MLRYTENYGEDIDGNRGEMRVFYEIEQSDEETIKEQVQEYLSSLNEDEDEDPDTELDIVLIDPVSEEDVYFTINVKDYR